MNHIGPDVAEARARVAARRGLPPLTGQATAPTQLRRGAFRRVAPAIFRVGKSVQLSLRVNAWIRVLASDSVVFNRGQPLPNQHRRWSFPGSTSTLPEGSSLCAPGGSSTQK
jgi:hypothetical protein